MKDTTPAPGRIVCMPDGTYGRTFNHKGLINGKVPVYPIPTTMMAVVTKVNPEAVAMETETPKLFHPTQLRLISFVD